MWLPAPWEWLAPPWECECPPSPPLPLLSDELESDDELDESESDELLVLLDELPFDFVPGAEPLP